MYIVIVDKVVTNTTIVDIYHGLGYSGLGRYFADYLCLCPR
jgi:hypothetical protein